MSLWEWLANVISVIVFGVLTYRMLLIVLSLPLRLRMLDRIKLAMVRFNRELRHRCDLVKSGTESNRSIGEAFGEQTVRVHAPFDASNMIDRVVQARVDRDYHRADLVFADWVDQISMGYSRHYGLANLATEVGMLGTVAGGIFAFDHIGTSDDPFAAFPSLALAMLTTAAGLIIAIVVKLVLGAFARRLEEVHGIAQRTIEDIVQMKASLPVIEPAKTDVSKTNRKSMAHTNERHRFNSARSRMVKFDTQHKLATSHNSKQSQPVVEDLPQLAMEASE